MSGLFGGKPPPPTVTPMPDPNDPNVLQDQRRQAALAATRAGRASTMLSDNYASNSLGGK